ncbi:MAG TPA: nuclear transport factor 2 family protein [Polyangiaceae bacterium]|nr:nuclear transport factor 2 family protein [Polyangiaceae bacterium]
MRAWHTKDLAALLSLLTEDVRFVMPPLPAWFDGRHDVGRFFGERVFALPWRLVPLRVNTQLGFACYSMPPGAAELRLSAVNLLCLRAGKIAEIDAFLDSQLLGRLALPAAPEP